MKDGEGMKKSGFSPTALSIQASKLPNKLYLRAPYTAPLKLLPTEATLAGSG